MRYMTSSVRRERAAFAKEMGARFRRYRSASGLKQKEVAKALGIFPSTIPQLEHGKLRFSVLQIVKAAALFKVQVADLIPDLIGGDVAQSKE